MPSGILFCESRSIARTSGQPLDASAIKAKADELRERAAAGEDFDQLQREAYKDLGINVTPPPTKLNMVRRTSLPQDEAKVFDFNVGELSPVLESGGALVILKLESKQSIPIESAGPEIKSILQRDRLQHELQSATNNVKAQFNLKYWTCPRRRSYFRRQESPSQVPISERLRIYVRACALIGECH